MSICSFWVKTILSIGYNNFMTQITREEVIHLAELSRLQLSAEEIDSLQEDITNILKYVEQLNELDTSDVEPTYQVGTELKNVGQDDSVVDYGVSREQLLELAPKARDNQVEVQKVL